MSPTNIELAHHAVDAVEDLDVERLVELCDPGVEWQSRFVVSGTGGVYRGHDGIREYMRDLTDAWEFVRLEVEGELGVGDLVILVGQVQTRGRGSGVESEVESGYLLKFRDGRLIRFTPFPEPAKVLESVVDASREP